MQPNDTSLLHIINERLQRIWEAHGLGSILSITRPAGGSINYCLIVNNAYAIRFDITGKIVSRFQSEALAYRYLCDSGVPVPEVVALDRSKVGFLSTDTIETTDTTDTTETTETMETTETTETMETMETSVVPQGQPV